MSVGENESEQDNCLANVRVKCETAYSRILTSSRTRTPTLTALTRARTRTFTRACMRVARYDVICSLP